MIDASGTLFVPFLMALIVAAALLTKNCNKPGSGVAGVAKVTPIRFGFSMVIVGAVAHPMPPVRVTVSILSLLSPDFIAISTFGVITQLVVLSVTRGFVIYPAPDSVSSATTDPFTIFAFAVAGMFGAESVIVGALVQLTLLLFVISMPITLPPKIRACRTGF